MAFHCDDKTIHHVNISRNTRYAVVEGCEALLDVEHEVRENWSFHQEKKRFYNGKTGARLHPGKSLEKGAGLLYHPKDMWNSKKVKQEKTESLEELAEWIDIGGLDGVGLVGAGAAGCSLLAVLILTISIITWKKCKVKNSRKKYNLEMVYRKQMKTPDLGTDAGWMRSVGQEHSERGVMAEVVLPEEHLKPNPPKRANDDVDPAAMTLDNKTKKTGEDRPTNEADDESTHGQLMREIKAYKHGCSAKYRYKRRISDKV